MRTNYATKRRAPVLAAAVATAILSVSSDDVGVTPHVSAVRLQMRPTVVSDSEKENEQPINLNPLEMCLFLCKDPQKVFENATNWTKDRLDPHRTAAIERINKALVRIKHERRRRDEHRKLM